MRIGIDGRYISDHFPGIGRYTYNLICGLAEVAEPERLYVVHNPALPNTRFDVHALARQPHVEIVETRARTFSLAEQWTLPRLAGRLRLDVWHAPYYIGPYVLPCPLVVTVHDAISSRYPQYLPSRMALLSYQAAMRLAMHAARRVIAVSHASEADLVRFFGVASKKMCTVYEAADQRYQPQPAAAVAALRTHQGLARDYVLYLGMNKPHKNVVRLVEAWGMVAKDSGSLEGHLLQLIVAGRQDPRYQEAEETARRLGLGDAVRFLGDVPEADLPALYAGATLFVFPSLYEGFGLPMLEAMACGIPVVCSDTPALLEIAGDAAITADPLDSAAIAAAMRRALADPALLRTLSRRSLEQAALFSWQRAARETLAAYAAAAGKKIAHGTAVT